MGTVHSLRPNPLQDAKTRAIRTKKIFVEWILQELATQGLDQEEFARRIQPCSMKMLQRLLDPEDISITLCLMHRAAYALGAELHFRAAKPQKDSA